jgi:hypothetical protein
MGVACADYDDDGDTDVFVANDGQVNFLFHNDGGGRFSEVGLLAGVAYNLNGDVCASMGVECGDFDNDGRLDFYVTNYQGEYPVLYRSAARGLFQDVSAATGAAQGALAHVTWGAGLVDLDNDGDRDLLIVCGHLQDLVESYDDTTSYRARNILLKNLLRETGQAVFENASDQAGAGLLAAHSGRGAAFDDLDNDGDIDVVVLNSRDRPTVLRNMLRENGDSNHWLQIELRGVKSNRDGVGARVRVAAGDLVQVAEVHSGRGYQSHYGSRLHFGLGPHQRADRVEVRWIGGGVDVLENVPADQRLVVREGKQRTGGATCTAWR